MRIINFNEVTSRMKDDDNEELIMNFKRFNQLINIDAEKCVIVSFSLISL